MEAITDQNPLVKDVSPVEANIERLRSVFPGLVTDGYVDFHHLRQILGDRVDDRPERFELNWHGKKESRDRAYQAPKGTLRPAIKESVDWNTTGNLMVEGDNLEVLRVLTRSCAEQVRVIYIDPPYNTGNDFVYPDNSRDSIKRHKEITGQIESDLATTSNKESSGSLHTNWLNMIYPRLEVAKGFLKENGVIMVSIDDAELANLRLVMDEVFGPENFVANVVWEKGRKNDAKLVSVGHEYLLIYARSKSKLREDKTIWREEKPGARDIWEQYLRLREKHGGDNHAIETDLQAWYSGLPKGHPAKKWSRYKRIDSNGPWRDRDISWPGGNGPRYDVHHPITGENCVIPEAGWRYSTWEEMQRQINLGLVEFRDDHTEPPFRKAHLRPVLEELDGDEDLPDGPEGEEEGFATQVRGSYFYKQSQVAVKALRSLMGAKVFDNPKDYDELAKWFDYVTDGDPDAVFMDFFAGSGSTGEAVMKLNALDGGRRRFMLVQLEQPLSPSKKEQKVAASFCDSLGVPRNLAEITKERLRRAGGRFQPEAFGRRLDHGFRVVKLDYSNVKEWNPDRTNLKQSLFDMIDQVKPERTDEDVLFELMIKARIMPSAQIEARTIVGKTVWKVAGGRLLACLEREIVAGEVEALGEGIAAWIAEAPPESGATCVFRDAAFENDVAKTSLTEALKQGGIERVRSL